MTMRGHALLALATAAAANLVAPELTISEDSSRILMISPREHRVYSRWDKTNHRALSPYGRAMADAVRAHALPPLQRARVLMLGLGGGVIPGDLLCNPAADVAAVTAVEAFPGVARLAEARFFPAIFSGACKGMRGRLTVVVGDALAGGLDAAKASGPRFSSILVDIPAAYEAAAGAPASFYQRLLGLGAPHASLVGYTRVHAHALRMHATVHAHGTNGAIDLKEALGPSPSVPPSHTTYMCMHVAQTRSVTRALHACRWSTLCTRREASSRPSPRRCVRPANPNPNPNPNRHRHPNPNPNPNPNRCCRLAERDAEACGPTVRGTTGTETAVAPRARRARQGSASSTPSVRRAAMEPARERDCHRDPR